MSSRYDEFRPGRGTDRQQCVPADDFTPPLLRSHYFVSAYLRYVSSLVVLAGLLVLPARTFHPRILATAIRRWRESGICAPIPYADIQDGVHRTFPYWDAEFGFATGVAHVFEWVFSQGLFLVPLLAGGVVALLLERWRGA